MIPKIITPYGDIPTFPCLIALGVLTFILILHISLRKTSNRGKEEEFIFPRLVITGMVAWVFAGLFDAIFKYFEYGIFEWKGITFYGGLIGAIISLWLLLKQSKKKQRTNISVEEWFQFLTLPLISFHFFGRVGCFFAGCCYGRTTNGCLGVAFPDQPEQGILHYGLKRYPTQLFEGILLLVIFLVVLFVKEKATIYLLCYSVGRFFIEFFRGDDRGYVSNLFSPAQMISIFFFVFATWWLLKKQNCTHKTDQTQLPTMNSEEYFEKQT